MTLNGKTARRYQCGILGMSSNMRLHQMLNNQRKREIFMARRRHNYLASLRLEGMVQPSILSEKSLSLQDTERLIAQIKARYAR